MAKMRRSRASSLEGAPSLSVIKRFVVLMLENRSFDHMLGYMKALNPRIDGMAPDAFNYEDPVNARNPIRVRPATATALDFDPSHEFEHVQEQLYGRARRGGPNPPSHPAAMSGFVSSSIAPSKGKFVQVMECFRPEQIPVFSRLAQEFAIFNYWYSPLPGATWPNRFFVHAGTSGGLSESPSNWQIANGFVFQQPTLYERLDSVRKTWRIYHDDWPQALGVWWLRSKFLSSHFRKMDKFFRDVASESLPDYTFIEPYYDIKYDFTKGNSMHPHNDVARGEQLIKDVYEAIRNSTLWRDTMLIITFDEHGGFYDHVPPPPALPTGDDREYASTPFAFDRYGIRVPTIVVSAYTERGTVIGSDPEDPATMFDHCSIPATVRKAFGFPALSQREAVAKTLDVTINRKTARTDAPARLPSVAPARLVRAVAPAMRFTPATANTLTRDQEAFVALAEAMDREMNPMTTMRIAAAVPRRRTPSEAAEYADRVLAQALAMRGEDAETPRPSRKAKAPVRKKRKQPVRKKGRARPGKKAHARRAKRHQ